MSTNSFARRVSVCALVACGAGLHVPSAYAADTFEPNDTRQTATPIASGSPRVSYVSTSSDIDYYTFTISGSQHVRIDLPAPDTVDYRITLDGTGRHSRPPAAAARAPTIGSTGADRGVYYIRVDGSPARCRQQLHVDVDGTAPRPDFEPNNMQATAAALPLGAAVGAFLFTSNDVDWYRIVTPADGALVVTLNVPDSVDYQLTLRDGPGGIFESSNNFGAGQDEEIVTTLPGGTYFIEVKSNGNYSQGQRYFLTATSGAFHGLVRTEQHEGVGTTGPPGALLSKVYTSDDQDWFRFNVSATGTVSIVLEVPPSVDLRLELWSGSGSFIASSSSSGLGVDESVVRSSHWPGRLLHYVSGSSS